MYEGCSGKRKEEEKSNGCGTGQIDAFNTWFKGIFDYRSSRSSHATISNGTPLDISKGLHVSHKSAA